MLLPNSSPISSMPTTTSDPTVSPPEEEAFWLRIEKEYENMFCINAPIDCHLHLRQEGELRLLAPDTYYFAHVICMPNIIPPIDNPYALLGYKRDVENLCKIGVPKFTLFLSEQVTPVTIEAVSKEVIGVKLYPKGLTTNSDHGIDFLSYETIYPVLAKMEELRIPLLGHFEKPYGDPRSREIACLPMIEEIVNRFPRLEIVIEHVTSKETVGFIKDNYRLHGTITAHHLLLISSDMFGQVAHYCKPVPKSKSDRATLREVAFTGHKKFMFGSDSAYHPHSRKLSYNAAAGIYSLPTAIPYLAELFHENSDFQKLEDFTSNNAYAFYGFNNSNEKVQLFKQQWDVPLEVNFARPFLAGHRMEWQIRKL